MNRRTLIILAAVAAVLGGFIWFVERGSLSSGELEERRGKLLERFVRARVTRIEIQRRNVKMVLVREQEEDPEEGALEVGTWKLEAPVQAEVEDDAVDSLISAMEWADDRRTIEGVTAADRERFGLDRPRLRAWFQAGNDRVPIVVGREAPSGEGVYVQLADRETAYVVGKDFYEALDHDADHFRSKRLFPGFDVTQATTVSIRGEGEQRRLQKEGERWHLRAPIDALASRATVEDVLRALDEARAARFVTERAENLGRYGLDRPWRDLTAERPAGEDDADAGPPAPLVVRLRVGGPCEGHPEERYAIAGESGGVVCVATSALEALSKTADELRERRIVTTADEDVQTITLVNGSRQLEVTREGDDWKYTARPSGEGDADDEAIAAWMEALRTVQPISWSATTQGMLDMLHRHGGGLRGRLWIDAAGEEPDELIEVLDAGWHTGGPVNVLIQNRQWMVELPATTRELFQPTPVRLRARRVLALEDRGLLHIAITRGGATEMLERDGNDWRITAPRAVEADRTSTRELARRLATLEAVRWVADRPDATHGLAAPRIVVGVRVRDGDATREHRVKIGAPAEGGAYAQVDTDASVFVASPELVDLLDGPLISRNLLQSDPERLISISINRGGASRPTVLRRNGDAWVLPAGAPPEAAERQQRLLDRIAALRAADVEAGPLADSRTDTTVDLTRADSAPEPHRYGFDVVPGQVGEGDAARVRVRVRHPSAPDVVYLFPPDVIETFREYALTP